MVLYYTWLAHTLGSLFTSNIIKLAGLDIRPPLEKKTWKKKPWDMAHPTIPSGLNAKHRAGSVLWTYTIPWRDFIDFSMAPLAQEWSGMPEKIYIYHIHPDIPYTIIYQCFSNKIKTGISCYFSLHPIIFHLAWVCLEVYQNPLVNFHFFYYLNLIAIFMSLQFRFTHIFLNGFYIPIITSP